MQTISKTLAASLFLSSIFGIAAPGSFGAPAPSCLASVGSWVNAPLSQSETHSFRVSYDATPLNSTMDGVSGLSSGPASTYGSLAASVRFNSTGTIDARNGGAFTASSLRFVRGAAHHFILDINIAAHTYNAYVVIGGVQHTLGTNLAFRSEQAHVTALNEVGALTVMGSQTVCNISVTNDTAAPAITRQPASASVTTGQSFTFSVAASGTPAVTYQWSKNGTAISGATSSSYTTPATKSSDNAAQFRVAVSNSAGTVTSSTATLTVAAPALLSLNSSVSRLAFGNVNVSSSSAQMITLTNGGNGKVTISQVLVAGAGFNSTAANGITLAPGQSTTLTSTFTPAANGAASGSISVTSNATNSPAVITTTGTGVAAANHTVALSWVGAASGVTGFNAYVGTASGGPYLKLTSTPLTTATFSDSSVQSGNTYYYVVTAVNASNEESGYSSEVAAVVK